MTMIRRLADWIAHRRIRWVLAKAERARQRRPREGTLDEGAQTPLDLNLSEYIDDLQAMLQIYGDGPILEEEPEMSFARVAVRSPRLRVITARDASGMRVRVEERAGPNDPRPRCYVI